MYFIYVLLSVSTKTRYIGSTDDVRKRVVEHNRGKSRYTSGRRPWKLIYCEEFRTRSEALQRERFLKTGQGRELLDRLFQNDHSGIV